MAAEAATRQFEALGLLDSEAAGGYVEYDDGQPARRNPKKTKRPVKLKWCPTSCDSWEGTGLHDGRVRVLVTIRRHNGDYFVLNTFSLFAPMKFFHKLIIFM